MVFVVENSKRYHKIGCKNVDGKSGLMYNINAAESMGYFPCPDCWKTETMEDINLL